MNKQLITAFLLGTLATAMVFSVNAYSAPGGSIQITSPQNGASIDGQADNKIVFDVHPSPDGNHLHFYVDDRNPSIVREWKGSYTLPALSPGKHQVCIKEAMANHVLTGLQKCVSFIAR